MISAIDELVARDAGNSMLLFSRKVLAPHPTMMTKHVVQTNENGAKDPALSFMDSKLVNILKRDERNREQYSFLAEVLGEGALVRRYFGCRSPSLIAPKWVLSRHPSRGRRRSSLLTEIKTYVFNLCT